MLPAVFFIPAGSFCMQIASLLPPIPASERGDRQETGILVWRRRPSKPSGLYMD
jgi:hypothetical protein